MATFLETQAGAYWVACSCLRGRIPATQSQVNMGALFLVRAAKRCDAPVIRIRACDAVARLMLDSVSPMPTGAA